MGRKVDFHYQCTFWYFFIIVINEPFNIWSDVKIELLKGYSHYFSVDYYNLAGEYVDEVAASDYDITVSPSSLVTVDKSTGSITAGSTTGEGTITITYKGLSYTFDFKVVSGFDMG